MRFLGECDSAKRSPSAWMRISEDYFRGEQDLLLDTVSNRIHRDSFIQHIANVIFPVILVAHAVVSDYDIAIEATPNTTDDRDKMAARVAEMVFKYHQKHNHSSSLHRRRMIGVLTTGDEFTRIKWDRNAIGTLEMTNDEMIAFVKFMREQEDPNYGPLESPVNIGGERLRAKFRLGCTKEVRISSNSVFVESGVTCWQDVDRYCVVTNSSRRSVENRYGNTVDIDNILTSSAQDIRSPGNTFYGGNQNDSGFNSQGSRALGFEGDTIREVEYFERSGSEWSRIVLLGEGAGIVAEQSNLPMNPIVHTPCIPMPSFFWSNSLVRNMVHPQYTANYYFNQALQTMSNQVKTIYMLPIGQDHDVIDDDYNRVLLFDASMGAAPIIQRADTSLVSALMSTAQMFVDQIQFLGSTPDLAQGQPGNRISGRAVQFLLEKFSSNRDQIRKGAMLAEEEKAHIVLAYWQQFANTPRMAHMAGPENIHRLDSFSGADLARGASLEIKPVESSVSRKIERKDLAIQLAQNGLLSPEGEVVFDRIHRYIEHGTIASSKSQDETDAERIGFEQLSLIRDGLVQIVEPYQVMNVMSDGGMQKIPNPLVNAPRLARTDKADSQGRLIPVFDPMTEPYMLVLEINLQDMKRPELSVEERELLRVLVMEKQAYASFEAELAREAELDFEREKSMANHAGQAGITAMAAHLKGSMEQAKGTPQSGGIQSGVTRGA